MKDNPIALIVDRARSEERERCRRIVALIQGVHSAGTVPSMEVAISSGRTYEDVLAEVARDGAIGFPCPSCGGPIESVCGEGTPPEEHCVVCHKSYRLVEKLEPING